jgi:CheY-like chemotaxis protein
VILFVDDDKRYIKTYIEELRHCGYTVVHHDSVDKAINFINSESDEIELLILDIMMPSGSYFKDIDRENGLRTGCLLLKEIGSGIIEICSPILVLTNVSANSLPIEYRKFVLRKEDFTPEDLAKKIHQILSSQDKSYIL